MSVPRDELLANEEKAWHRLHSACASLSEDRWNRPNAMGDWSIKDVYAHCACWAAEAARQLECIRAGSPSRTPEVEEFNKSAYESCRGLSIPETIAMGAAAHHRLQQELEVVAPVALNSKVVDMIRECSDRHYLEHLAHIEKALGEAE